MVKEKRILSYFISWLVLGFIVCFFGITKTYAAEQKTGLGFLNNSSVHISNNKGADIELTRQTVNNVSMDIKSIVFVSNYNFQANTVYEYEIEFHDVFLKNVDKATILSNNGICTLIGLSGLNSSYTKVRFTCSSASSFITIGLSNSNDNNITDSYKVKWNSIYLWSITDTIDLGPIINNQTQNTQDILNNDNQNTQDIIDSNKETQDVIKDQFNSCRDSYNLLEFTHIYESNGIITKINENGSLNISGIPISDWANLARNESIILKPGTYTFSTKDIQSFDIFLRLYTQNSGYIDYTIWQNQKSVTFTLEKEAIWYYVYVSRLNIGTDYNFDLYLQLQEGSIATEYEEPNTEICTNKLDEQNDKLSGIQGALTDSSAPNTSGLENSAGWLPAGPLDSILNLPLTMLNSLTNSLSKTCSPLNLTLPYVNKQLQIPCLSSIFAKITGVNGLWTWVGTIASVLILYNYLLNLYAWVDRVLTLRAEFDEAMGADLANWGRL